MSIAGLIILAAIIVLLFFYAPIFSPIVFILFLFLLFLVATGRL